MPANIIAGSDGAVKEQPDLSITDEFLAAFYEPDEVAFVTAIKKGNGKFVRGKQVPPSGVPALVAKAHEKKGNCYFHVAQTKPADELSNPNKSNKDGVVYTRYLHVDIDARVPPRDCADLDAHYRCEIERCESLLFDKRPGEIPEPHIVVRTGGGVQAFWRLDERVPLNGDPNRITEFERYGWYIECALGGDNCRNADRIMRVPGSVNHLDPAKIKKGRKKALVTLTKCDAAGAYPLSAFKQVPKRDEFERIVPVVADVPFDSVDQLRELGVRQKFLDMVTQPDWAAYDGDKSDLLWAFIGECVKCHVPDDWLIEMLVTYPVGAHVQAQKRSKTAQRKVAARQLERYRERGVHPMLPKINDRYFVIKDLGSKVRVCWEKRGHIGNRSYLAKQDFTNFKQAHCNKFVEVQSADGGVNRVPLGEWWLTNPMRREYDALVFAPGIDVGDDYNLWQGFEYDPLPGDWSLLREHIRRVICAGNSEHFDYVLKWLARAVQQPDKPAGTAIVLRGAQGTGKSFFVKMFGRLFGRHYLAVSDPKHLVGSFNYHLRDCVVLFGDEAFYAGDRKHESILKTLITEDTIHYEAKGVDSEQGPNCVHLLMASNNAWVVPTDLDDRRFLVLDVADTHQYDSDYFNAIAQQLDGGGFEAMLHELSTINLKEFVPGRVELLRSKAKEEQKLIKLRKDKAFNAVYQLLVSGESSAIAAAGRETVFVCTDLIIDEAGLEKTSRNKVTGLLKRCFEDPRAHTTEKLAADAEFTDSGEAYRDQVRQPKGLWMPSLIEARMYFAKATGVEIEWPDEPFEWPDSLGVDWSALGRLGASD